MRRERRAAVAPCGAENKAPAQGTAAAPGPRGISRVSFHGTNESTRGSEQTVKSAIQVPEYY